MKKSSKSSLNKCLLIYLSSIKTKLAINFVNDLLHLAEKRGGAERLSIYNAFSYVPASTSDFHLSFD